MEKALQWFRNIALGVTLIFVIELMFGYTGAMIFIAGTEIRTVLFVLSAGLLYLYCLLYVIVNRVRIFGVRDKNSVFGSFRLFDWALVAFTISSAASVFVIPRLNGVSFLLAKQEGLACLCMLLLYFPIGFMIRRGLLNFDRFEKILYWLCLIFSVQHIALYVGEMMHGGFIEGYFDLLQGILGPAAQFPPVILGHGGYPRVMFLTSIYIIVGFYLVFRRLPKLTLCDYIVLAVHVTAFLTTMTKSVWYGVIVGLLVFTVLYGIKYLRRRNWKELGKYAALLAGVLALVLILNATLFNGMVVARMNNSFNSSISSITPSEGETELERLDREGALISNDIKIEQTRKLLGKWLENPIFGCGYGAYVEGYTRSDEAVFSYEMQLPALLMKIGVVGVGLLLFLLIAMVINLRRAKKDGGDTTPSYAWLFLLSSFGVCAQTNPLLLNYNGMSLIVLLLASCAAIGYRGECVRLSGRTEEL